MPAAEAASNRRLASGARVSYGRAMVQRFRPSGASYEVSVVGDRPAPLRDLYHRFLGASWPAAIAIIAATFLIANVLFALVYVAIGGVTNMPEGSLLWAFFFSVQTMGTIGYGVMAPASVAANAVVVAESVTGMLLTALFTGLVFAKFSQPVGRIVFSRDAVVTQHEGQRALMFRVGNERGNRVVEAQIKVDVAITTVAEGRTFYKQTELVLRRSRIAALSRTWNVIHVMNEASPLFGLDPAEAERLEVELMVTVVGLDDTTGQTIHGQHLYEAKAIRFGRRFADVLTALPDGNFVVDVRRFHDLEPD